MRSPNPELDRVSGALDFDDPMLRCKSKDFNQKVVVWRCLKNIHLLSVSLTLDLNNVVVVEVMLVPFVLVPVLLDLD